MVSIDFIFYLDSNWSTYHRPLERFTELAHQLNTSQGNVLIVDRPVDLFTSFYLRPAKFFEWVRTRNRIRQLDKNLFLYTPFVFINDLLSLYSSFLISINHYLLTKQVNKKLTKLNFYSPNRVVWISDPRMLYYFGISSETVKIYECIDKFQAVVSGKKAKKNIQKLEDIVSAMVDVVFCTSLELYQERKELNRNTYFLPNAADTGLLSKVQDPQTLVAKQLQKLHKPVIGYLGTINENTDIALMKYIAEEKPEWTIVMIGPERNKKFSRSAFFSDFKRLANVKLIGWVNREELPNYCKAFDVCVIPYRTDSELNRYVDPNKVHEYIAMGKPVISTCIPGVLPYKDIIMIADTPQDFIRCIERSLNEDSKDKILKRLKLSKEHSWEERARKTISIIKEYL